MKFSLSACSCLAAAFTGLFLAGAENAHGQRALGIDVSSFQGGSINWTSVKGGGYTFAWTKATEGVSVTDADYAINMPAGKAAGVYMGGYDYAHPEDNTPANEAAHFWAVVKNDIKADGLTLNPMLDIEGTAFSATVGASSTSDWINNWCTDIVQDAANNGVNIIPCIYISACNAGHLNSTVTQWGSDIADYNNEDPQSGTPWSTCASDNPWGGTSVWNFWQYSSTLPVTGISDTTVDHDVYNGTAANLLVKQVGIANTNSTIFYWDPQKTAGANPYTSSMTGTWETSFWSSGSAGLATTLAWVNGKAASFGVHTGIGTPAYTVTMNTGHVVAGFFDGALGAACDVTITGAGQIDLASGAQGFDAHNPSSANLAFLRVYCNIAGSGKLYPEGNGQSYLYGDNSYTGGTELGYHDGTGSNPFSGTNHFILGTAYGTGPITLTSYGNGAALMLDTNVAVTVTNSVNVASATTNNIVGNAAGLTFSGNWSVTNLLYLGTGSTAGNQTIISGVVSGASPLTFYNAGTLVLSGVNTYTGKTTNLSPSVLTIGDPGQLGSGSYAGTIFNTGTFNYNSTASQTLSGIISGTGTVKMNGAGLLTLTAVNTYTGATTVAGGGTLAVTADSGLGATSGLTLNGGTLKNNNSTPTIASSRTITLGASGGYLDAGGTSKTLTIAAKLSGSGKLLINQDSSAVVLSNVTNNYTGNTIIGTNGPGYSASGTTAWLKLGASAVLPYGSGKGNVIIQQNYNGLLDLAGTTQTINGLSGDGIVDNTTGNGALSVGSNNVTSVFNGTMQDTVGTLTLIKLGTGKLTLGGTNAYSGNTTITAGTLALGLNGSINNTPQINLAAGTTFDVSAIDPFVLSSSTTLNAAGTASAATIKGATSVNLGSQPITLTYDGSHPALTISQGTLSLNGNALTVNGTQLPVGNYTLIQQTTGTIAVSGTLSITGTVLGAAGTVASLNASGGSLILSIAYPTTTTLSSLNDAGYAQSVTLTATVAPSPSSGTVQFFDNSIALGSPVTVSGGIASYTTSTLSVGSHPITASFSGASGYLASATTGSSLQQITNNITTTTLSPLTDTGYQQPVVFTAIIAPGPSAGTVQFYDDSVALGDPVNVTNATAQYFTSTLDLGTHPITASFSGATGFGASSTLSASNQVIVTNITTTTLSPLTNSIVGQSVTFTATITPTPTNGTVQFLDNSVALGDPVTVTNGTASYTTAALTVGTHPITASFSGTTGYLASVTLNASNQIVSLPATVTTVGPLSSSTYGQTVILTATVSPDPAGGTVQFFDNNIALGSLATVSGGIATYNTSALAVGTHPITASFSGSSTYAASSTLNASNQVVLNNPTTITLSPLTNSFYGQTVTLFATVSPTLSAGTVQFFDNNIALGDPVTVSGGVAIYSTNNLTVGSHPITASYSGTTGYAGSSTLNASNQVVSANPTSTTLSPLTDSTFGQSVTFTATVSPTPSGGKIQFYDNSVALGSPVALTGGSASYSTTALTVGTHPITAAFSGTNGYTASSTLNASNQVIAGIATTTTLTAPTRALPGQSVTFTATVAPDPSGGTVQFFDNAIALGSPVAVISATASYSTSALADGSHPITAAFSGVGGYAASSTAGSSLLQVTNVPVKIDANGSLSITNGTFQFGFTGNPGGTYLIQAATNLTSPVNWVTISTNTADGSGQVNFVDPIDTNAIGHYYRTAMP